MPKVNLISSKRIRTIALYIMLFISLSVFAEDIIVLRSGDIIKAVVKEVTQTEIKYKKSSNPKGPLYTINKSDVLSINYSNGTKDSFSESNDYEPSNKNDGSPKFVDRPADSYNSELLSLYRKPHDYYGDKKPTNKTTDKGTAFFAFTKESVLSNDDLLISFLPIVQQHFFPSGDFLKESLDRYGIYYKINIQNKTEHNIYIDCASSYIMDNDGNYVSFFDTKSYTETHGGNKSAYFNLGGLGNVLGISGDAGALLNATTLGSSSASSLSVSERQDRLLMIPPKGNVDMPQRKYLGKNSVFNRYEYFPRPYYRGVSMKKWQPQYFEEGELPSYLKFCFTYSSTPNFATYSTMKSELYCYEIIGQLFDYYVNPNKLHNSDGLIIFKRMDDGRPLYVPVYDQLTGKPKY